MWQLVFDLFGWVSTMSASPAPIATPEPPAAPVRYIHPRANRRALLEGVWVAYELRRGRRRTIGFAVTPEGLTVRAPRWTPLAEIDTALRERSRWIIDGLGQARERAARLAAARIDWRAGAVVPYLGAPMVLAADSRAGPAKLEPPLDLACLDCGPSRILYLPLPSQAMPAQWRAATADWLTRQARRLFTERLDHYAPQLGVRWQRLSLSSARTRWGSASSAGWIRLNWRLIHLSLPMIDYVVVHELAHLREMNHGPGFWACVGAVLPDYAARRATLRDVTLPGL